MILLEANSARFQLALEGKPGSPLTTFPQLRNAAVFCKALASLPDAEEGGSRPSQMCQSVTKSIQPCLMTAMGTASPQPGNSELLYAVLGVTWWDTVAHRRCKHGATVRWESLSLSKIRRGQGSCKHQLVCRSGDT